MSDSNLIDLLLEDQSPEERYEEFIDYLDDDLDSKVLEDNMYTRASGVVYDAHEKVSDHYLTLAFSAGIMAYSANRLIEGSEEFFFSNEAMVLGFCAGALHFGHEVLQMYSESKDDKEDSSEFKYP